MGDLNVWEFGRIGGGDECSVRGTGRDGRGCVVSVDDRGIGAKIVAGAAGVKDGTTR